MPYPVKTDNDYWASIESFAGDECMKRLNLVEYDCGPGCSSYGQVIAADLERETENPRPADIPESSGEPFPPYMVARGGGLRH